jgi:hypothetical protein
MRKKSFGKETYNNLFTNHSFIEAKKRLFYQTELITFQIIGTAGALGGLIFSFSQIESDKTLGYIALSSIIVGGSAIIPFYFTNKKALSDILNDIDTGKISFSEGYKKLKMFIQDYPPSMP